MSENADLGKQRVQARVCFWVAHFFPQTCHVGIVLLYRKLDWAFRELNTKINRHKYFLFSPLTQLAGGKSRKEKRKEIFFARFFLHLCGSSQLNPGKCGLTVIGASSRHQEEL